MLRRSGPHLAQTWRQRGQKVFWGGIRWEVKIDFTLRVYAQHAQNFMGNSNMHGKHDKKKLFAPDLPPAPPQIWLLRPDPHSVILFSKTPTCVCSK